MDLLTIIDRDTLLTIVLPSIAVVVVLFIMLRSRRPKNRRRKFEHNRTTNTDFQDLDNLDDIDTQPQYKPARDDDELVDVPSIVINENDDNAIQSDEPAVRYQAYQRRHTSDFASKSDSVSLDLIPESSIEQPKIDTPASRSTTRNELLVVLNIIRQGQLLQGAEVVEEAQALDLQFGRMGIYHFYGTNGPRNGAVFSMANMLEPGTFDVGNIDGFTTPGLTLFMQIPGPMEGMEAFALMLGKARELAKRLHASVCDEHRSPLTRQGAEHIFEQIREHQRKLRLAQRQA